MQLEQVVPFGRSLDEYRLMFSLSGADVERRILGAADGPASFNAELHRSGKQVVSLDPLYRFTAREIEDRFHAVVDEIIGQVKATPADWVWRYHRSPEHLRDNRVRALTTFLADYDQGRQSGRYQPGELPQVPFAKDRFDLALCSHFLFLYSDHLSYEFHRASIQELLRVAPEVRIFPLLTLNLKVSPYLDPLLEELSRCGHRADIVTTAYELQRGGNQMLRIFR